MKYSQLARFKEIKEKGQKELRKKTVALVGLGNIGSTVAVMLLRSGINIRLIDKGRCSISDASSQLIYVDDDDTKFKAKQAKKRLEQINPEVKIRTFHENLNEKNDYLLESDAIIDTSNNLNATKLISNYSKKSKTPVVYAVSSGSKGLVITSDKGNNFDKIKKQFEKLKSVDEEGNINPAVFMASAIIVKKIFKILLKKQYHKDVVSFDVWKDTIRRQKL